MTATAAPAPTISGRSPYSHRQIVIMFVGLGLGMFLAALDQTIVSTALPTITGDLGGLSHLSWVVTAYLLATTVSTPLYGKLGDILGRKRLFQISIGIFLAGSMLSGMARSMPQLIAFRAVQGLGAGGLMVLAMAIIAEVVSPRERGRYQGYFGAMFSTASIAGPLIGGFFTDHLSWRWVFYVNVPIGIVAFLITASAIPSGGHRSHPRIDYVGAARLAAAVSDIVLITTWGGAEYAWGSPTIIGMSLTAVAMLGLLLVVERRVAEPILPIHLYSISTFRVCTIVTFIVGVAMMGSIAFLPVFLQTVNGVSATNSGLSLVPFMLGMMGSSVVAGQIISRSGRYKVFPVVGTALASVAMILLSRIDAHTTRFTVSAYMLIMGTGLGLTMQVMMLAIQNSVRNRDLGAATGSANFFRSVGASLGVALYGAVFNNSLTRDLRGVQGLGPIQGLRRDTIRALPPDVRGQVLNGFADAVAHIFVFAAPLLIIAFVLVWLLKEHPLRDSVHSEPVPEGEEADAGLDVAPEAIIPAFH